MKILSHRGYWKTASEKNGWTAFTRSFDLGFGTETDVRDFRGKLTISHDPPVEDLLPFNGWLDLAARYKEKRLPLAINIKSDGLAEYLARAFHGRDLDWFVFDMSIPDLHAHLRMGNPTYVRMSEFEQFPARLKGSVKGVWLDAFQDQWFDAALIEHLLGENLEVCLVSPELHGREPEPVWAELLPIAHHDGFRLCTDHPEAARAFFSPSH